jgi:hypothetical protein
LRKAVDPLKGIVTDCETKHFDANTSRIIIEVSDGTTLTVHIAATDVVKFIDTYDEQGNPRYNVSLASSVVGEYPEALMKK